MNSEEKINVWGARVHNLKNIDVEIPRDSLTVITGLSGSGKSSLAFDTIFAEGQRRYIETFSAYARNFLGNMERPDVDKITGGYKNKSFQLIHYTFNHQIEAVKY
jgi:excinuclease ABC subunit A